MWKSNQRGNQLAVCIEIVEGDCLSATRSTGRDTRPMRHAGWRGRERLARLPAARARAVGHVPLVRTARHGRQVLRLVVLDDFLVVALPREAHVVRRRVLLVLLDQLVARLCARPSVSQSLSPQHPLLPPPVILSHASELDTHAPWVVDIAERVPVGSYRSTAGFCRHVYA